MPVGTSFEINPSGVIVRLLADSEGVRARYADLLAHCATGTVYQTIEWLEVWKRLGADLAFVEVDQDTMLPFVCRGRGPLRRAYSLPFDTYGGPVTANAGGTVVYEDVVEPLGNASARVVDFAACVASVNGAARNVT